MAVRLTDAEYAAADKAMGNPDIEQEEAVELVAKVEADHRQAREDVRRLVERLRARVEDCCGSLSEIGRCAWCLRDAALLSEVGP